MQGTESARQQTDRPRHFTRAQDTITSPDRSTRMPSILKYTKVNDVDTQYSVVGTDFTSIVDILTTSGPDIYINVQVISQLKLMKLMNPNIYFHPGFLR